MQGFPDDLFTDSGFHGTPIEKKPKNQQPVIFSFRPIFPALSISIQETFEEKRDRYPTKNWYIDERSVLTLDPEIITSNFIVNFPFQLRYLSISIAIDSFLPFEKSVTNDLDPGS